MTKDDKRVRETVQAELRRRRGVLDKAEERSRHLGNGHTHSSGAHAARAEGEYRRGHEDQR